MISVQKVAKKKISKKSGKNFEIFFFDFSEIFFEIIPRERRLRTQNFMIVGQTVSAVGELTDGLGDLLHRRARRTEAHPSQNAFTK